MQNNNYFLTMDIGTTSVKISLISPHFEVKYTVGIEYLLETNAEKVEVDAELYWSAVIRGIQEMKETQKDYTIIGICVTTQGETMIPVDECGTPLAKAVVWLDARASKQADKIADMMGQQNFYTHTGVPICNAYCPVSKLLWFKEEEPQLYEKAKYILLLEDYIIYKLTGEFITEKSLLSTTGYFDLQKDEIWYEILEKLELNIDKIPKVMDCGETIGKITEKASEILGISADIPVITGAMDQVCAAIGAGNILPGMITETTGTALCMGETVLKTQIQKDWCIPVYRHAKKELQLLLPVCMTGGMSLKWFKDQFCETEIETAENDKKDIYELLSEKASKSEPLAKGLLMIPYLSGMLQPIDNPSLRGSFFGMGLEHKKEDFLRSIMEGVSFMLKENIILLKQCAHNPIKEIISMGGGAKSELWCQIKSNVLQMPVMVKEETETTSVGAAVLCSLGIGMYESMEEAVLKMGKSGKIFIPEEKMEKIYEEGYKRYEKLLLFMKEWYSDRALFLGRNADKI